MPAPVEALQLLALLTRARQELVDRGEFHARKLYDVRSFKCCFAELGYLRRLAYAGRTGGTVVTSMPQLVAGLAAMHPRWDMSGLSFERRDRHHSAVRRRLNVLQAMGLLRWRAGVDDEGQERRTEIELCEAPDVDAAELGVAARQLERWQARYGAGLNTGSSTGIRNAAGYGRPLSASERQRRGCEQRKRRRERAAGEASESNSAPPSGVSATPQNNHVTPNASDNRNACVRTSARKRVTRTNLPDHTPHNAALDRISPSTTGIEEQASGARGEQVCVDAAVGSGEAAEDPSGVPWDEAALFARVQARQARRAPVMAVIAVQATARALEVAGWELERAWPAGRLREAWVVARYGSTAAAESGVALAGPLVREAPPGERTDSGAMPRPARDDLASLRRAVRRYQDNVQARPEGWPTGGLAALLYLGALAGGRAGELPQGVHLPRTIGYAVGALDQLSRRMRALATADSDERRHAAAERARARRQRRPAVTVFAFRQTESMWPAWVVCDERDQPVFDAGGMLQIDAEHPGCRGPGHASYDQVIRDAYLLADRRAPLEVDGRAMMAARYRGDVPPAQRRAGRTQREWELVELAKLSGLSARTLERMDEDVRAGVLRRLRAEQAGRARAELAAIRDRLSDRV